jgi:hypothetical protein
MNRLRLRDQCLTVRVSTVFVGLAGVSLVAAVLLSRLPEPSARGDFDTIAAVLYFTVFPVTSLAGAVAAAVFLVKRRFWQFAVELVISVAFLVLLGLTH